MFQEVNYYNREIVWARVPSYPWWPARIVNSFQQDDKIVYKVSFFGDPTYCFLHQDDLLHFTDLDPSSEEYSVSYSKLKKPVQLAKAAFSKKLNQQKTAQNYIQSSLQTEQPQPPSQQHKDIEFRENTQFPQKTPINDHQPQSSQSQKQTLECIIDVNVSIDSIIDILDTGIVNKLRHFRGYTKKKITHDFTHQLQHSLLSKYNLCNLEKPQKVKPIRKQLPHFQKIHKQKHSKPSNRNESSIRNLCVRKLYSQLKDKYFESSEAQQLSIKICDKLEQQGSGYSDKFKKMFVVFMKWMNKVDKIHLQNFDSSFFQTFGITKKEDHQNSKITDAGSEP